MFNYRKLFKIIVPTTAAVLLLAGCGSKSAQHHESKSASAPSSKVENHAPKDASTSDGGTKTTNTNTPNLYAKPKSSQISHAGLTQQNTKNPEKAQKKVAQTGVKGTDSAKAVKAVHKATDSSNESDLPTVDLGNGVVGHEDRGAGQIYIAFRMGDWKIEVHGNDVTGSDSSTKRTALALNEYLQSHSLPVPNNHGFLQVDAGSNQSNVRWQEGSKVDSINGNLNAVLHKICE